MSLQNPDYQQLNNGQLSALDGLSDRFEESLRRGDSPVINDFLQRAPEEERRRLFEELLSLEFDFHLGNGQSLELVEYESRFPAYVAAIHRIYRDVTVVEPQLPEIDLSGESETPSANELPITIGDFRIIQELGRGGMGVVYEAEQASLERRVALKVLARNVLADGSQRERFEREARAAARLHHSNIVPVFGVGSDGDTDFLVMQLIRGLPLDSVISELNDQRTSAANLSGFDLQSTVRQGAQTPAANIDSTDREVAIAPEVAIVQSANSDPQEGRVSVGANTDAVGMSDTLPVDGRRSTVSTFRSLNASKFWREIADLIRQAAEALQYAHEQGVLHRDIKPGNLLLDTDGRLWVADFGLAKAENSENLTQTGLLLGTVKYMPPEAFRGQSDATSDVYSLGLSLYELATLQPAFSADGQNQLVHLVMHQTPATVSSINPEVPRDLQTIIHKAIERDPQNRYATAADFAEDLRRFCHDEPILARRVSIAEQLSRWARQHKMIAGLVCALAVVVLSATTMLSFYANRVTGLNTELSENAVQLTTAKNSAHARANENAELAMKAQSSLVGMKIASAFGHVKDGKIHKALVEMQAAWDSDTFHSRKDRSHQMRIGALLDHYPEVVGLAMSTGQTEKPQYQPWNDLLMLSFDGVAEIWKPSTAEVLWRIQHDSEPDAELSCDGRLLITRRDNDCLVWDVRTGKLAQTLKHETPVSHVRFSPDGTFVATACGDQTIRFWKTTDGSPSDTTIMCDDNATSFMDFVDNDRIIASNDKNHVRMWSTRTGEPLTPPLIHRPASPRPPAFTIADGRIATVDRESWFLWDLKDGSRLADYKISKPIESVHFCEHGGDVLVNAPSTSSTWHYDFVKSLKEPIVNTLTNPRQSFKVAISSGGDLAATRSTGGTAFVWNLRTQKVIAELANVRWLEFVDYRRLMVTGTNATRIVVLRHRHPPRVTEPSKDGLRLLQRWQTGDTWTISGVSDGSQFRFADEKGLLYGPGETVLREYTRKHFSSGEFAARFSLDGTRLLTIDGDLFSIWDAATGNQIGDSLLVPDKTDMHLSADGNRVALFFDSEHVAVWDMVLGKYLCDGRPQAMITRSLLDGEMLSGVSSFYIAPDGAYVVICHHSSENYHVIDVDTGEERFQIDRHYGVPAKIQFTNDSTRFVTANSDTTVRIWDARSGAQVGPHLPHPTFARAATINNDGSYAATRDASGDIRTWDVRTGEQLGLPIEDSAFQDTLISFSDDLNRLIATPSEGDPIQHRLSRVRLDRESSRLLVELVTNLQDSGSGRSETLTDKLMKNRDQYIAAWQQWRKNLNSPSGHIETVPTENLLPRLAKELDRHSFYGEWTCDGETLTSDELRFARVELPVEPTGSYQISMDFTRRSGNDHIGIQLPFYDGRSILVVDSDPPNGLVSLEGIDGRVRHSSGQTVGVMAPANQERHLVVTIIQTGPQVFIRATLDDTEIYRWSGPSRRLIIHSVLEVPHPRRPAIQTHKSRFEIRNVRVTKSP